MSVLPGGPGRMQGLRTQPHLLGRRGAPGFCLLHHTYPSCSGDTRGRGTSGVRTLHARGHSHTLTGIYIHTSQIPPHLLSKLVSVSLSCIVVPCWFPHPSLSPQPSVAPYCLETKSRFPSQASGASPDLTFLS